jgi:hypothetical protein
VTAFHSVDVVEITGKGKVLSLPPKIILKAVTFYGGGTIAKDDGSGLYDGPHWQNEPRRRHPYLYSAGQTLGIAKASWLLRGAKLDGPFLVRGSGSGGIKILESKAVAKATEEGVEVMVAHPTTNAEPFPMKVRYFNPFEICWELSCDGGKSWHDAGTSSNPIYVRLVATRT